MSVDRADHLAVRYEAHVLALGAERLGPERRGLHVRPTWRRHVEALTGESANERSDRPIPERVVDAGVLAFGE